MGEQKLLELKAIHEEKKVLEQQALEQRINRRQRGKEPHKGVNDILCLKGSLPTKVPELKFKPEETKPKPEEVRLEPMDVGTSLDDLTDNFFEVELQSLSEGMGNILVDDLEFLESLDVEIKSLEKKENSLPTVLTDGEIVRKSVVPVKIVKEDTKNLEDWLDDFLDD